MSAAVKARFAGKQYEIDIEQGIQITKNGRPVVRRGEMMLAAKAVIAAACELERLDQELHEAVLSDAFRPDHSRLGLVPERVDIEGKKYTVVVGRTTSRGHAMPSILRNGEPWIEFDENPHSDFWFVLAGALFEAREKSAMIAEQRAQAGSEPSVAEFLAEELAVEAREEQLPEQPW